MLFVQRTFANGASGSHFQAHPNLHRNPLDPICVVEGDVFKQTSGVGVLLSQDWL